MEADGGEGRRTLPTLRTESICWEKGCGWDSNPSSTTQLAPSVEAARELIGYSLDVTDRIYLHVHRPHGDIFCQLHLLHLKVSSRLVEPPPPRESSAEENAMLANGSKSSINIWGWISTMKCPHHTNKCGSSRVFTDSLAPYGLRT